LTIHNWQSTIHSSQLNSVRWPWSGNHVQRRKRYNELRSPPSVESHQTVESQHQNPLWHILRRIIIRKALCSTRPHAEFDKTCQRIAPQVTLTTEALFILPVLPMTYCRPKIWMSRNRYWKNWLRLIAIWQNWKVWQHRYRIKVFSSILLFCRKPKIVRQLKISLPPMMSYSKPSFLQTFSIIPLSMNDLSVSRLTAAKYWDTLAKDGLLVKEKIWRTNYYINPPFFKLLQGENLLVQPAPPIISRHLNQA